MSWLEPDVLLEDLAKCLDEQIKASRGPDVCFVGVVPGEAPVADDLGTCDGGANGMAWVRMMTMYPASGVNVISESVHNCGSGLGMDIELGMLRPFIPVDERGEGVGPEGYQAAMRTQTADALTMRRALQCCTLLGDIDYILGSFTPAPVLAAVGGTWVMAAILD